MSKADIEYKKAIEKVREILKNKNISEEIEKLLLNVYFTGKQDGLAAAREILNGTK